MFAKALLASAFVLIYVCLYALLMSTSLGFFLALSMLLFGIALFVSEFHARMRGHAQRRRVELIAAASTAKDIAGYLELPKDQFRDDTVKCAQAFVDHHEHMAELYYGFILSWCRRYYIKE